MTNGMFLQRVTVPEIEWDLIDVPNYNPHPTGKQANYS